MANLDWKFRDALAALRPEGRLAVLLVYLLRSNVRRRAWPSINTLIFESGWEREAVVAAKKWLVDAGALVPVAYSLRVGEETKLHQRVDVMQITGTITINDKIYPVLYLNEINSSATEILPSEPEGNQDSVLSTDNTDAGASEPISYLHQLNKLSDPAITNKLGVVGDYFTFCFPQIAATMGKRFWSRLGRIHQDTCGSDARHERMEGYKRLLGYIADASEVKPAPGDPLEYIQARAIHERDARLAIANKTAPVNDLLEEELRRVS